MSTIDLGQLAHVDSVELKRIVPNAGLGALPAAVGLDLRESEIRQVYYFDTPDLTLLRHGVVLRARQLQRGECDTVVKLRPVAPAEISEKWRAHAGFTIEADVAPTVSTYAAALKCVRGPGRLEAALAGERPLDKLFSKHQRALLRECGPSEIDWPSLRVHGPVGVLRIRGIARRLGLRVVVELWRYPDGSSIAEVSTKVRPRDLARSRNRLWTSLRELGLDAAGEQQTKAERTLAFFAA